MPSYGNSPVDERDIGEVDNTEAEVEFRLEESTLISETAPLREQDEYDRRRKGLLITFRFLGTAKVRLISACFRSMVHRREMGREGLHWQK